ncbi:MAG: RsmB/NOP family class I SAM-dependent RNA methyltransferase [Candidatus Nanoarchaeia archaeon]|jgi:NOL1/NOP2/sun family putative RNA methylase
MNLIERYKDRLPVEDLKSLVETAPQKTIRVNTLKTNREELMNALKYKGFEVMPHPLHEQSIIIIKEPFSIGATPRYLAGYYMLQDTASMIAVTELNPLPGELVLDMAAAPGAKTTHISALMNNQGVVIACDNNKKRLRSVLHNCARLNCDNVIGLNIKGQDATKLGLEFDKILLDAPCSAEGTIHKNPKIVDKQTPYKKMISEQLSLMETGIKLLKKGGTLIYSTCTINPDENEGVVKHALNQGMKLVQLESIGGKPGIGLPETKRFCPNNDNTQGFFIARLVK